MSKEIKKQNIYSTFSELENLSVQDFTIWCVNNIDIIIRNLESYINLEETLKIKLDKSEKSMIKLWYWFQNKIEIKTITEEKRIQLNNSRPNWAHQYKDKYVFSEKTELIARHIAIYLGESLKSNTNKLSWGIISEDDKGFKRDIYLTGFVGGFGFYLYEEISKIMFKSLKTRDKYALLKTYHYLHKNIQEDDEYIRLEYFNCDVNVKVVDEETPASIQEILDKYNDIPIKKLENFKTEFKSGLLQEAYRKYEKLFSDNKS